MLPQNKGKLTQYHNCRLIRNHTIIKDDLWVRDGKILNPEPIFFDERVSPDLRVDCHGCLIAPGYIDIQINGGFGEDFSDSSSETIKHSVDTVAKNLLKHGVTSFCPTIITSPSHIYKELIPKIPKRPGSKEGAQILGIHIEGPFLSVEKRGAHPMNHIRAINNGFKDVEEMYGSLDNIIILTMAPEVDKTGTIIKELVKRGIKVSVGHSMACLQEGEEAVQNGASLITHLFNAMLPFHHRDPGLVGLLTSHAIPEGRTVYFGIISDGIHTHPAALRIAHRTHPSGLILITDAIAAMGLGAGVHNIGQQQMVIQGKRALIAGTNTLCGSIAILDDCVRHFREASGCSIVEAIECATLHPAQALEMSHQIGTLDFGTHADFILLDDELNVLETYIHGECVWKDDKKTKNQFI